MFHGYSIYCYENDYTYYVDGKVTELYRVFPSWSECVELINEKLPLEIYYSSRRYV